MVREINLIRNIASGIVSLLRIRLPTVIQWVNSSLCVSAELFCILVPSFLPILGQITAVRTPHRLYERKLAKPKLRVVFLVSGIGNAC